MTRLPFQDVEHFLAGFVAEHRHPGRDDSTAILARRLNTARQVIRRWRAEGLSERQADRIAVTLDQHPSAIFTDWDTADDQLELELEETG